MKLGLITDIHEQVEPLRRALDRFRQLSVDRIVMIGDVFAMGERIEQTCSILAKAGVIGVWGNHDFGLCVDVADDVRTRYAGVVVEYMAIGALCEGRYAVFDTDTSELVPINEH